MLDARNCEKNPQNSHHFKRETNKSPLHYTLSRLLYRVPWYNIWWRSVKVCGRNRKTLKQTDTHKGEIPKVKMKSSLCLILDTASCYIILHTTSYRMFFREVTFMAVVFFQQCHHYSGLNNLILYYNFIGKYCFKLTQSCLSSNGY